MHSYCLDKQNISNYFPHILYILCFRIKKAKDRSWLTYNVLEEVVVLSVAVVVVVEKVAFTARVEVVILHVVALMAVIVV